MAPTKTPQWAHPAGCAIVFEEHYFGADRSRPLLAATHLETTRERTLRGGTRWRRSSAKHLLTRAEQLGLAASAPGQIRPEA